MVVNPWDREAFKNMFEEIMDDVIDIEDRYGVVFTFDWFGIKTNYSYGNKANALKADDELQGLLMDFEI